MILNFIIKLFRKISNILSNLINILSNLINKIEKLRNNVDSQSTQLLEVSYYFFFNKKKYNQVLSTISFILIINYWKIMIL